MLKLNINLVFTIINLLVFYWLMKKFLFGPVMEIMDKRKKMIEDGLAEARSKQEEALGLKKQYEEALADAGVQSEQIVARAKENAKAEYDRIVKDADVRAGQMINKAQENIELEKEKTIRELKNQVAELAMEAAMKVTEDKDSAKNDRKLYEQFLEKAGDADETGR